MAFIAFESGPAHLPLVQPATAAPAARFSALEWLVVALARKDKPSTLKRPGRIAVAMRMLFSWVDPGLADERLEALRRLAVLAWTHGPALPSMEVERFLAAGFTPAQHRLLLDGIAAERRGGPALA